MQRHAVADYGEEWMSAAQCRRLTALARQARDLTHGAFVEVGVWTGRSAVAIARGCAPHALHAVDHWLGDIDDVRGYGVRPELAASRDVYAQFLANLDAERVTNVQIHKMAWQDFFAVSRVPPAIRFLHIDGAHDYASVAGTIAAALPYMVLGGIMAFDDANQPEVSRAIFRTLGHAVTFEVGVDMKLAYWQC